MNSSLRSLVSLSGQSVAYGIGVFGSQFISYLTFPVLTHALARDDYGAVAVITAIYAFLNTLTNAGLPPATFRFYNDSEDAETRKRTLGTAQFLFVAFAAVPAFLIILFGRPLADFFLGSSRFALALQFAACFLIIDSTSLFGEIVLRIQVRPLAASLASIATLASEAGLALFIVIVFHMGAAGYWLGYFLGSLIGLAIVVLLIRKMITFKASWSAARSLLAFSLPLVPATLSITALRLADRYMIGNMIGLDQAAVYDVGYKIGSLVSLVIGPFRAAWQPFAFSIANKPDARRTYRDVLSYIVAGCVFAALGLTAFRTEILRLVAPNSYAAAAGVVAWVAVAQLFQAAYLVLAIGPMIMKRTRDLAWAAVTAGALNVVLNLILIPRIGILGAAVATLVGYAVLGGLAYVISRRLYQTVVDWRRMGVLLLAAALVGAAILGVERLGLGRLEDLGARLAVLLAFVPLLILFEFMTLDQIKEVAGLFTDQVRSRLRRR